MKSTKKDDSTPGLNNSSSIIKEELRRFHSGKHKDELIGKIIHERYEIVKKIGGGGMGDVYVASDKQTDTNVAIKIITAENNDKKYKWTERFFIEAKAAMIIDHPNVINIFDVGTFGNKIFCVMEYLEGEDLSKKLEKEKKFDWETTRKILIQICDALEAAHTNGILHRDMKPANIFIANNDGSEFVKVLDFGLAKFMSQDENITREGLIMGTPTYMAPEQAWGGKDYDQRADLYALGVMLYEMLSGKVPFRCDTEEKNARIFRILVMHREEAPRPPREIEPSISVEVQAIIMRALEKDPAKRFQTAREFKDAILECDHSINDKARESQHSVPDVEKKEPVEKEYPAETQPHRPKEKKDSGFFKKLFLVSVLAGGGVATYHYKEKIITTYESLVRNPTHVDQLETRQPTPQPSSTSQNANTFEVIIDSNPRGASVYDKTLGSDVFIGGTPLRTRITIGDHNLVLRKRGFAQQYIHVNLANSNQTVVLSRAPSRPRPVDSTDIEDEMGNNGPIAVPSSSVAPSSADGEQRARVDAGATNPPSQ